MIYDSSLATLFWYFVVGLFTNAVLSASMWRKLVRIRQGLVQRRQVDLAPTAIRQCCRIDGVRAHHYEN